MRKETNGLKANIFSRTFNVFNPFPEPRKIYQSYLFFIFFSPMMAFVWTFITVFIVFMQLLEAGLLLAFVLFLFSLGFMMISEATEIHSTASTIVKAVKIGKGFGQGDIEVLAITKNSLHRLSAYYLLLTATFACLFFILPIVFPLIALIFSHFVGVIVGLTVGLPFVAALVPALPFAFIIITIFFVGGKVKAAVLGLQFSSRPTYVCSTIGLKGIHDPFALTSHIDDEDENARKSGEAKGS